MTKPDEDLLDGLLCSLGNLESASGGLIQISRKSNPGDRRSISVILDTWRQGRSAGSQRPTFRDGLGFRGWRQREAG